MAIVTFKGDYETFFRPSNTPFKDLIEEASWRGVNVERLNGHGQITVTDIKALTCAHIVAMASTGLEITGFPCFIKMSPAKYAGDVPVGMSNRTYMEYPDSETQNEVTRKWNEWKASNHGHQLIDGYWYVPGNSWGEEITGAEMKVLDDLSGYELLTPTEYQAAQPEPEES